jgi:hypothetical protein
LEGKSTAYFNTAFVLYKLSVVKACKNQAWQIIVRISDKYNGKDVK